MRVAVIGAGRIGALHARTLIGVPEVDEVLVADDDGARAQALARELGCVALDGVEAAWAARPAGVVVASPTATHAGLVSAALDAGVGVFCEKPLTLSLRQSGGLALRARRTGTPVMVGFQRRFDPAFRALRARVGAGEYGTLHLIRVRHADSGPPPAGYLATSGTMFVDQCIHDYDAIGWLAGRRVEAVSATGGRLLTGFPEFERHDDVDTAVSVLALADGAFAVVEAFRQSASGYEVRAEIVGSAGVGGDAADAAPTFLERFADAFRAELHAFVAVLAGRSECQSSADDATEALRVALAAERSFREQRVVRVDDVV